MSIAAELPLKDLIRTIPQYDPYAQAGDCVFEERSALRVIDFFSECLTHIEGRFAGKPFILEPWQRAIVGNLFGWKRPDGSRRYRELFMMVPRGNGKTPLIAGVCLYLLACDGERGAQIYSAAADKDQASLLYRHARGMVENEPELSKICRVFKATGSRAIALRKDNASVFRVLSSDVESKHGFTPHAVLADEVHAWPTRDLMDVFQTAFSKLARRQPLLALITTADYEREGSICNEKQDYAEKVRDGRINDPSFLPVIYRAEKSDNWTEEATWVKANPNIDVTVDRERLRVECLRAKSSPQYLNEFLRLHLNVRTQSFTAFVPLELWDRCEGETPDNFAELDCYIAFDLSSTRDLTAVAYAFPIGEGRIYLDCQVFLPGDNLEMRERRDGSAPYRAWIRQGWLKTTPGNVVDYAYVKQCILDRAATTNVRECAFDPWNATQVAVELQQAGIPTAKHPQDYSTMNGAMKTFERMVSAGTLVHSGSPIMRWAVGNLTASQDHNGNLKPSKAKSKDRIDPVVAAIMAVSRAARSGVTESSGGIVWL